MELVRDEHDRRAPLLEAPQDLLELLHALAGATRWERAADADCGTDGTIAPGAADTVVDHHANVAGRLRMEGFAQAGGARIRILGEQQHGAIAACGLNVGSVHAGIGQHEAAHVLDDNHASAHAQHLAGLAENDFHETCVFVGNAAKFPRARRRHDAIKANRAALGFRDDLLREYEDVPVFE